MDPRETAIGLVRYVTENAAKDFDGESIAAIIYRLRVVENYVSSDVDIICEAMRILIKKLVNLPPITFSPDVWMPIMTSITEGAIEPQWRIMMESIDISKFSSTSSNFVHMDSITASSTKCSEQITSICKGFALEFGLTRRLFSAIWNTDLEETARKMMNQEWDSVKIDSSPDSAKQAAGLIEKSIFDLFSEMKDHETFANELYYAALARILKRLQENKKPAIQDSEDISFYESSLHIYDELIKKLWPHLSKKDPNVKKNTLIIFEKLISLSPTDVLVQRITEKFIDSCEWLKISGEEICTSMEPRLWKIVGSLVSRILDLKKTIPYEIVSYAIAVHITQEVTLASPEDCGPDSFDSTCDQPSNMKERFLRHMVDSTRSSLLSIIQFLRTAKSSEEIVQFMRVFYPELVFGNETLITHAAIEMLRESASHHSIKADDFISIVLSVIDAPAIVRIIDVISCIKDEKVRKEAVEKTIIRMANDLEDEDQKREGYVNHLHENGSFWNDIAKYADASILDKAGKRFVEVSVDSMDIRSSVLATDIFLTILKLKLTSEAEREPESCVICNVSYSNIKIDLEKWNKMGNILVECNMVKRSKSEALPLFTIHQLENIDLPMRDLVYVVTQMKFLDTKEGMELHRKFYDGLPGVNVIFEKFMSKSHKIELCMKLLDEFAKIIAINEKSLIFSLDHENILDWLEEIGVLDSPQITEKLVDICFSIEVWDVLTLLQLDGPECHYWDLQMFGRFWKTSLMDLLDEKMMKKVNEKMGSILKEQYDKQSHVAKATREKRSNGKFPNRPKVADWEEQLLLMHNRIAGHLTKKKVEDFADESTQKFTWLLGVCSGQMSYKKEVAVDAEKILSRLYPDAEKRNEVLYHFGVSSILKGLDRPRGKLSLHILFMQIYLDLVQIDSKSWKIDDSVQKLSRRLGGFNEWLMIVDEEKREDDGGFRIYIVLNLSHYFWELLEGCKASQVVDAHAILKIRKFAEVLASILDKITFWPNPKLHAYYYIAQFLEPLETIFHFPEIAEQNRKVIESFFKQLFDKLLEQKYQEGLLQDTKLIIQKTDKYLSSSLNLFNEYNTQEPSKIYPVNEIFSLFCRYGSENVHLYCLKMIKKSLQTLASNILEHEHILKGEVCIETELQKRLVCDAVLLTEFFGYFSCIYAQVSENQPSEHDDVAKAFMLLDSDIHLKTKSRKRSTQNSVAVGSHRHQTAENMDLNFCTYKSTGRAYVTQHWYNCYTCNMMESEGVCSVCAINCHRGHDLAYSKKGSFFCDCGEKKCGAMQGIYHLPNSMYSLRGQLPEKNGDKTLPKIRNVFEHRFENLNSNCCDELKSALNDVQEEFKEVQDDLEQILEAVDFANQKALQVTEERLAVLESFNDMDDVIISEKEKFIEPLESGHFLPTRRDDLPVQELRVASSQHKIRELSDIIKLDDGTELLVLIPESIQTCLQLHYMDTRTNLIQGMHALRTETEQIPFNARSLHVSGNRLVVCGQYEFFALRFSPQGDVIDRAHIKLLENGASSSMNNNPVVRAKFCREIESDKRRRQLIAVATMQYIRIYDLTLHETNFVEEMVLPAGNVEDVEIINQEDGNVRILVLSSSGYLYEHNISVFNAENNSIFLTNVVNTPGMDMNGDGVSLHYSSTFNLLFVSLENGAFVAQLPEPTGNSTAPIYDWKHLNIKNPVDAWKETSGIIACLSTNCNHQVNYFHPTVGKILLQKTSVKRSIMTYFLMTSAKNQSVYSVLIYPNVPTCEIWETSWNNVHDLWIDDVPTERYAVEVVEQKSTQIPIDRDELVLLAEQCEQIRTVDWNCREIGMFYTHEELNNRLSSSDSLPITLIQQTHFKLSARITNFRQIVRMIRVEVEGNTGPEYLKIGTTRYSISSRGPKTFDLRLSREESLALDHRDITIEVIPRSNQNRVTLKSLRLLGCDRSAMDEIQPRYERQPILTNSNKLVYSILEFATLSGLEWAGNMAKKHLSRKLNHPAVCSVSTRAIVKCHPSVDEELFKIIDGAYLQEWKALIDWTESEGFGEMRLHHVEQLLDRMEAVRTRWPYFVKSLKREFGTVTSFVELMRNEMKRMPLHRCQMMAQAIVKIVFGLLSNGTNEAEQLIHVFLNIFTDQDTYHLANDMRARVCASIARTRMLVPLTAIVTTSLPMVAAIAFCAKNRKTVHAKNKNKNKSSKSAKSSKSTRGASKSGKSRRSSKAKHSKRSSKSSKKGTSGKSGKGSSKRGGKSSKSSKSKKVKTATTSGSQVSTVSAATGVSDKTLAMSLEKKQKVMFTLCLVFGLWHFATQWTTTLLSFLQWDTEEVMTITDLGYIQAFGSLCNAFGALAAGQLADTLGAQSMFLLSAVFTAIYYSGISLARSWYAFFFLQILRFGYQLDGTAEMYLATVTTESERTSALMRLTIPQAIAMFFGPIVGSKVAAWTSLRTSQFIVGFVLAGTMIPVVMFLLPTTHSIPRLASARLRPQDYWHMISKNSALKEGLLIRALLISAYVCYEMISRNFLLRNFMHNTNESAYVLLTMSASLLAVQFIVMPIVQRTASPKRLLQVSLVALFGSYLAAAFANSFEQMLMITAVQTAAYAVAYAESSTQITTAVELTDLGKATGLASMVQWLTHFILPIYASQLVEHLHYTFAFYTSALLSVFLFAYISVYGKETPNRSGTLLPSLSATNY